MTSNLGAVGSQVVRTDPLDVEMAAMDALPSDWKRVLHNAVFKTSAISTYEIYRSGMPLEVFRSYLIQAEQQELALSRRQS